jgi:hypothetical protein
VTRIDWISLSDRLPPDEQFVLLTGDSGYTSTPSFVTVGRRYEAFRPARGGPIRWLQIGDTPLSDYGWEPTHWAPLTNRPSERWGDTDKMVFLPGNPRSFRCDCGGNVFRESRDVPLHYRCNSCSATYTGEG